MRLMGAPEAAAVDRELSRALARLTERMPRHGASFEALGHAIRRALDGGKRLRPALVVSTFTALDGSPRDRATLFTVAAAYELLHTALLMHDDVIDRDTMRRGTLNVSGEFRIRASERGADAAAATLFGDTAGILAGDLLLHAAQRSIALLDIEPNLRRRLLDQLDDAVVCSAAGELADVEHAILDADTEAIFAATHDKTAIYSFSSPLQAGAAIARASGGVEEILGAFGSRLGVAYQLVDDLIGAFGTVSQAGKAEGADLREAKKTPLIALARGSRTWADAEGALAVAHTGPIALRDAQEALDRTGARSDLHRLVLDTVAEAVAIADDDVLPPRLRGFLRELTTAVVERIP